MLDDPVGSIESMREQHRPAPGTPSKRDVQRLEGTGFGAGTLSDPGTAGYSTFERH
jgi:hypothetical protein